MIPNAGSYAAILIFLIVWISNRPGVRAMMSMTAWIAPADWCS